MEHLFLETTLAFLLICFIASITSLLCRKINLPYSLVLVGIGLIIGKLAMSFHLPFIHSIELSPELVFYIFLPTLIFEGAYNIKLNEFKYSIKSITFLATIGVFIPITLIFLVLHYLLGLSLALSLVFAIVISPTDPIAVLALFKKLGAPKRLVTIMDGESLFNDGTVLVIFAIALEYLRGNFSGNFFDILISFITTVFGGILVGLVFGIIFTWIAAKASDNENVEITITLILAHFSFILADHYLHVSGVLAVVFGALVLGNYGENKINPVVKKTMSVFWEYASFIANSFIFILIGLSILKIDWADLSSFTNFNLLDISLIIITTVLAARAFSIYSCIPLVNKFTKELLIPSNFTHVINWGGLRGALSIVLVISAKDIFTDPSEYNFLMYLTMIVILFILFINGNTIGLLLKKLKLNDKNIIETFEKDETTYLMTQDALNIISNLENENISNDKIAKIKDLYQTYQKLDKINLDLFIKENTDGLDKRTLEMMIGRFVTGIGLNKLNTLFIKNELSEFSYTFLQNKLNKRLEFIEFHNIPADFDMIRYNLKINIIDQFFYTLQYGFNYLPKLQKLETVRKYEIHRARKLVASSVITELNIILKKYPQITSEAINQFITIYSKIEQDADKMIELLKKENQTTIEEIEMSFLKNNIHQSQKKLVNNVFTKMGIHNKVYKELVKKID